MDREPQPSPLSLLLDTRVDGRVDFTARSLLSTSHGSPSGEANGGRRYHVPVAGSKGWLSSMVEVGSQEANLREAQHREEISYVDDGVPPDAFFAVDLECVLHKYRRWHECFPRVKPFYAVKCNPNSEVVRVLAKASGCGFDCASPAEMNQVLECGVEPSRIIYANPCKDAAALEHALDAGISTMTFDSKDELHKIRRLLATRAKAKVPERGDENVQVVLRLRVPDSHSDCPLGEKFGAAEEACSELINLAVELRLPLVGISFHCGSGCQNAQAYPAALGVARSLFDLAARQGVKLTLLDIGGGFPGWDGSECVYQYQHQPLSRGDPAAEGVEKGRVMGAESATTSSVPSAMVRSVLDRGIASATDKDRGRDRDSSGGDSGITVAQAGAAAAAAGAADGGDKDGSAPLPPLSLAEIARVTVPVLDELFPPHSGVQVIAEPGRYFVEASHLLFARIYAKRSLALAPPGTRSKTNGADKTCTEEHAAKTSTKTTAYYIDEGVNGCFKDRVLCGVNFEPCPVSLGGGGRRRRRQRTFIAAETETKAEIHEDHEDEGRREEEGNAVAAPAEVADGADDGQGVIGKEGREEEEDEDEDAVVMGPSGLPLDVVARKRLPKSLKPGDWLYFSQMGAYTASIATVTSSAVLEASYCYVASTPEVGATATATVVAPG
eukprot:g11238.t1